ncbi:MAG TPA: glycoside hydrolase family 13 protein [Pseudomonadota bacterium]|nr:glycoside hydrolase family 13 protein [Pseudomonadota bacterium]
MAATRDPTAVSAVAHRDTGGRQRPAARILAGLIALVASTPALAGRIERVDPESWWVGMRSNALQLMVHGEDIAGSEPRLAHPGVRIDRVTRVASRNYLFVDLEIDAATAPVDLEIHFERAGETETIRYPLRQRAPGSAARRGFGPRDVILNLMPDRYADGDPANDSLPGYTDRADRAEPGGRHGGDLAGLSERLDYIAGMGYTMVWPTPLMENNQPAHSYHGYAVTDLYRVDPRFGSNDDYRRFVAAARARGVGVIQDIVPNHIGSAHPWMQDLPTPDWINNRGVFQPTRHARNALSDPYAAAVDREDFTRGWFVASMPDLNQRQPLLATYLMQNAIWWIEFADLAGYRVDTVGYSDTAFMARWTGHILAEYPEFSIVGEEWSLNPLVVSRWQLDRSSWMGSGRGMPNMMDFPLAEGLRRALAAPEGGGDGLMDLYSILVNDTLYPDASKLVLFEGNHDMPRIYSVLGEDLGLWRMAMVYLATAPRIPQLYYGTELLMTSPTHRDDAAARRDFPGGWRGDAASAFDGRGLDARQREAQDFLRKLLNWRRQATAVHRGRMLHYAPDAGVYVYFRHDESQRYMVVLNKNATASALDLSRYAEGVAGATVATDVLGGGERRLDRALDLSPRSALILALD